MFIPSSVLPIVARQVSEGFVRLRHLEHVLLLLDRGTLVGGCIEKFQCELLCHGDTLALTSGGEDPTDRESRLTLGVHLDRDLIHGTGNALGADLDQRRDVQKCLREDLDRSILRARCDDLERVRKDAACNRFLPLMHETTDEFFEEWIGTLWNVLLNFASHDEELRIRKLWVSWRRSGNDPLCDHERPRC